MIHEGILKLPPHSCLEPQLGPCALGTKQKLNIQNQQNLLELLLSLPKLFYSPFEKLITSLRKKKRFEIWVWRRKKQFVQTTLTSSRIGGGSPNPSSQTIFSLQASAWNRILSLTSNSGLSIFPLVYKVSKEQIMPKTSKYFYSSPKNNYIHAWKEKYGERT